VHVLRYLNPASDAAATAVVLPVTVLTASPPRPAGGFRIGAVPPVAS
jgi:hypothetical protein